jgi:GNAT superfamily N-acetyltransferase
MWRPMVLADLAAAERVAEVVHADYPERPEVFAERLALFPAGCLIMEGGYVVAHPARRGAPPPLDALLGALPDDADALHLHDVALLPELQGRGLGGAALRAVAAIAVHHGLPWLSLVAVRGMGAYWARLGFAEAPASRALASYGLEARYMVRRAAG